jgi:hypothetical protein
MMLDKMHHWIDSQGGNKREILNRLTADNVKAGKNRRIGDTSGATGHAHNAMLPEGGLQQVLAQHNVHVVCLPSTAMNMELITLQPGNQILNAGQDLLSGKKVSCETLCGERQLTFTSHGIRTSVPAVNTLGVISTTLDQRTFHPVSSRSSNKTSHPTNQNHHNTTSSLHTINSQRTTSQPTRTSSSTAINIPKNLSINKTSTRLLLHRDTVAITTDLLPVNMELPHRHLSSSSSSLGMGKIKDIRVGHLRLHLRDGDHHRHSSSMEMGSRDRGMDLADGDDMGSSYVDQLF